MTNGPQIKNPLPSVSSLREFYASVTSNLMFQLIFNPHVSAYTAGGQRSVFSEGLMCTLITTLITIPGIARAIKAARAAGELPAGIPENRLMRRLPRNPWGFALLVSVLLAPLGGLWFSFIFNFYGFTSWTFYQLFVFKLVYLTVLGKSLVALSVLRFTQPDLPRKSRSPAGDPAGRSA
ncbi:MAG: hypothetical protein KTQ49_04485 [Candidatus Omnitrophica bacterium]|nr:hypothetical protein [Candidatus Omnitrophota bacterium]